LVSSNRFRVRLRRRAEQGQLDVFHGRCAAGRLLLSGGRRYVYPNPTTPKETNRKRKINRKIPFIVGHRGTSFTKLRSGAAKPRPSANGPIRSYNTPCNPETARGFVTLEPPLFASFHIAQPPCFRFPLFYLRHPLVFLPSKTKNGTTKNHAGGGWCL